MGDFPYHKHCAPTRFPAYSREWYEQEHCAMAKSKFITHDCSYCHKQTKMEFIGAMEGAAPDGSQRSWYRCSRCKHSALITLSVEKGKKTALPAISRDECTQYTKDRTFTIGEHIYHTELDDVGRVVRKDKTSNGTHSIIVSFEKVGERRLLENVAEGLFEEVTEDPAPTGEAL
jgi:hypothetical protein